MTRELIDCICVFVQKYQLQQFYIRNKFITKVYIRVLFAQFTKHAILLIHTIRQIRTARMYIRTYIYVCTTIINNTCFLMSNGLHRIKC